MSQQHLLGLFGLPDWISYAGFLIAFIGLLITVLVVVQVWKSLAAGKIFQRGCYSDEPDWNELTQCQTRHDCQGPGDG